MTPASPLAARAVSGKVSDLSVAIPPSITSHAGRSVRRRAPIAAILLAGAVCVLGYLGTTGSAVGPASEPLGELGLAGAKPVSASLSFSGADTIITGSVDHLFETGGFVGPNRSDKGDRFKPVIDTLEFAQGFDAVRTRLAALRAPAIDAEILGQTSIATADAETDVAAEPRISVASLNPAAASAALGAIDSVAGTGSDSLLPATASEQLAYARANAPVSDGYVTGEAMQVAEKQLWCLATGIYFEARGEPYRGQVAVAQVIMNRVKDHRYPDTLCSVVFQNQHRRNACQFSFACDGIPETINDRRAWATAEEIAKKVTDGELYLAEVGDATHYHATYVNPAWGRRMNRVTQIGLHIFYKFKSGWLFG